MKTSMNLKSTFFLGGDLEINRMGFGAMRIAGPDLFGEPEDPKNSADLLNKAVELGVNFMDTANQYGPFVSERIIAETLYPYPKDLVIATKGGMVRFGTFGDLYNDGAPQHLEDALEGSLRRLKLERIDLYQLHRIDEKVPAKLSFGYLAKAQQQGKVRHLGLSEVSVEQIKEAQQFFKVASVQNRYSILDRAWEPVLDYCKSEGIAFIPWFPMGGGRTPLADKLKHIADSKQVTVNQLALSWLLHHADNILLIPGTSNLNHLEENVGAAEISLTEEEMYQLDHIIS